MIAPLLLSLMGIAAQEGPLGNASFQPTSNPAQEALARGDALILQADPSSPLERGLDAWRQALLVSKRGEAVKGSGSGLGADLAARITFGVEEAVLRRIEGLSPTARSVWCTRFEPLAKATLETLPTDQPDHALAQLERRHPATPSAARAAVILGDRAAEEGLGVQAQLWWQRAQRHARLCGAIPLSAPIERRLAQSLVRNNPEQNPLARAQGLKAVRSDNLENFVVPAHSLTRVPLGRGMRLGAAHLSDGSVLVQGPRVALWYPADSLDGSGQPERIALISWSPPGGPDMRPLAAPSAGGWSLLPASDGERTVLIIDRGEPGRRIRGLDRPPKGNSLTMVERRRGAAPLLGWTRRGPVLSGPAAGSGDPERLDLFEYQPGPLIVDDSVFVLARTMGRTDEESSRDGDLTLISFDLATGEHQLSLWLTQASDLARESNLLGYSPELRSVCMPLARSGGTLVCGTNSGLVAAVDLDGRLQWTMRTRRRAADGPGWPGSRPPLVTEQGTWVAPGDSDRLYRVDPSPGGLPLINPIVHLGETLDLAGVTPQNLLLMGRDGPRQALLKHDLAPQQQESLLHLGPGERFTGTALQSPDRVLFATNHRLYLLDRSQQMLLLAAPALTGQDLGGDLVGLNDHVLLLGTNSVRVLRVLR